MCEPNELDELEDIRHVMTPEESSELSRIAAQLAQLRYKVNQRLEETSERLNAARQMRYVLAFAEMGRTGDAHLVLHGPFGMERVEQFGWDDSTVRRWMTRWDDKDAVQEWLCKPPLAGQAYFPAEKYGSAIICVGRIGEED